MFDSRIVRTTRSPRLVGIATFVLGCVILVFIGHVSMSTESQPPKIVSGMPVHVGAKPRKCMIHPVSLRIIYQDTEIIPGEGGELHSGTATYIFKNLLPIPVKLVFPPMAYTVGGSIPITPQCNNVKAMPGFCRKSQVVEIAANAEHRFTSEYNTFAARNSAPPEVRFVFGPSADPDEKGVVVDYVEGIGKYENAESTERK